MYVFAHNQATAEVAWNKTHCWGTWVQIIVLEETKYFESSSYATVFPYLRANWRRYDYIITTTYKTLTHDFKAGRSALQSVNQLKHALTVMETRGFDVFPFLRAKDDSRYWGEKFHGRQYTVCWDALLTMQGFSIQDIQAYARVGVFYRNAYIAKVWAFEKLVVRMKEAMALAESDPMLRAHFMVDSKYAFPDVALAQRVFHRNNYEMHPFIFERLPAFYLFNMSASICLQHKECPENFL